MGNDDWTDERIDQLKLLWAEGLSTAQIGRKMGISKNAAQGKAHRLQLTPRPPPIVRRADGTPYRTAHPGRAPKRTLPPLASVS